jgi:hypothetical protein
MLDPPDAVKDLVVETQRAIGAPLLVMVSEDLDNDRVEYGWLGRRSPLLSVPPRLDRAERLYLPLLQLRLATNGYPLEVDTAASFIAQEACILLATHCTWAGASLRRLDPNTYVPVRAQRQLNEFLHRVRAGRLSPGAPLSMLWSMFCLSDAYRLGNWDWGTVRATIDATYARVFVTTVGRALHQATRDPDGFIAAYHTLCALLEVEAGRLSCPAATAISSEAHSALILPQQVFAIANGVIASDQLNAKGHQFTLDDLVHLEAFLDDKPLVYVEHDQSRPPVGRVLHTHLICGGTHHELRAVIAVTDSRHAAGIRNGEYPSFSVAIQKGAKDEG